MASVNLTVTSSWPTSKQHVYHNLHEILNKPSIHIILRTVNFFSQICHLHMPNLHIQTLNHVYANELYIWQTQRKSNTHNSNDIWPADKQYHSDKNDPNWKDAGIL